jgi:hypothetical protein
MRWRRGIAAALAMIGLAACQAPIQNIKEFKWSSSDARIVVMPADVQLYVLDAGGMLEPEAEWTATATKYLTAGMRDEAAAHHVNLVAYDESTAPSEVRDQFHQISKLFGVVGDEIVFHTYFGADFKLPTKGDNPEWSVGPAVEVLQTRYNADYALLTYLRDSYSSAGRVALMAVGAVLGVGIPGGAQVGYTALVDLRTGDIVWFHRLVRASGDARDENGARDTAKTMLEDFPK